MANTVKQVDPQEIADKLLRQLVVRFVKLVKAEGHINDRGQMWLKLSTRGKLACEATVPSDWNYDRILRTFSGWCEQNAIKLGAKPYNVKEEDEEADAA